MEHAPNDVGGLGIGNQVMNGPMALLRNNTLIVHLVGGVDNGIDGGVLIYNASSGLPITSWLSSPVNQSMNYYVVAITWSNTVNLGYTEMGGYELSSILGRGGLTYMYLWVRENITLKPINKYPMSSTKVLIKAPNGELVQGGILCVVPVMPVNPWVLTQYKNILNTIHTTPFLPVPSCTRVNNGVVYLSGLFLVSYILYYQDEVNLGVNTMVVGILHRTINVYGYPINVTVIESLVNKAIPQLLIIYGLGVTVPSNNSVVITVYVRPILIGHAMANHTYIVMCHPMISANACCPTCIAVSPPSNNRIIGTLPSASPTSLGPTYILGGTQTHPPTPTSNNYYLFLITMVLIAIIIGIITSIIVTKTIYKTKQANPSHNNYFTHGDEIGQS